MDLLYVVLRTLLICAIGLLIAFQGRRMGLSIFNLTGRLNRLQFIICFIALIILFHIVHYIDDLFLDFVVSLPAYWFTRVIIWILLAALFPLSCILFGRRIHDIGFKPGQPEPNQYGNPPFMPVNRPTYESMQQPKSETEREIRKTVRKRRKKR